MKSRKRCLLVAMWLALPSVMSLELGTAFTSEVVLSRYGLVTAALNLPGFLLSYPLCWRLNIDPMTLVCVGDLVFWVPLFYGVLRLSGSRRARRATRAGRAVTT